MVKYLTPVAILLLTLNAASVNAQQLKPAARPKIKTLKTRRAGVHISFVKQGEIEPLNNQESRKHVWLRFHNNSHEAVELDLSGVPDRRYGDAGLFFDIEDGDKVVMSDRCHVCSFNLVAPGRALVFIVPMEWCELGTRLRVKYRHRVADAHGASRVDSIEHSVVFNFSDIVPKRNSR